MVAASLDSASSAPKEVPLLGGGSPFVGHLLEMKNDPLRLITRVREELGDLGALQIGRRKIYVVSEPHAIERILVDHVKNYSKETRGYEQLRKMLGNGLVTSEGSFWLRQRRIAQPAFHREKLAGLSQIMVRDTDEYLARIKEDVPFDINSDMTRLTMRIIGEALFSVDVSGDSDVTGKSINELVHQHLSRTIGLSAPMFVPTPANRRFRAAKKNVDALAYRLIAERRAKKDGAPMSDLLSMLMDAVDEETGERMTDDQLRDEVLTLFAAGHETTSMAVSWTLHALLDAPDVIAKLREELSEGVSVERLMRLPYLDAVLKESMRLHPPVWSIGRLIVDDDELCGFRVPRGHLVFTSQWVMHRHPKYWSEPLKFDPARFLVEDPSRPKYVYFPFLGGPRKCIGDQLSILESKIILAHLVTQFDFEREPGHDVIPDPAVTLRMKNGLWVRAHRR